jgi:E1A/CREB-binding protein
MFSFQQNITFEEALKTSTMGKITIRQVTSTDRKYEVLPRMKKRYAFRNYPAEFNFRCKCIIVFQNLDGIDVILFGLYVYEHDENNPAPNKRTIYLSYLDSVHFMRPRKMRTYVYHEILIAYLDYVRKRGFATAHIWACPPGKGDDYILYAKPENQKTPKDDRLRLWYMDMLLECQRRAIVGKITNMHELYFSDPKNDATIVPYMDGDYFPGEVENVIRDMEEGKHSKKGSSDGKKKKSKSKSKSKAKAGRGGTRSTGLDEEALAASGIVPPGYDQKSIEEGNQDYVMQKLGQIIEPMKDTFLVAYLAWEGATDKDMAVSKEIMEHRERNGYFLENKKDKSEDEVTSKNSTKVDAPNTEVDASLASKGQSKIKADSEEKDAAGDNDASNGTNGKTNENASGKSDDVIKKEGPNDDEKKSDDATKTNAVNVANFSREGKFAAMEARKRSIEGKIKSKEPPSSIKKLSPTTTVKDRQGRLVKVIHDDEEEMDCEFLNNRQSFLELCQTNNYQFDQLRRAKHSSMMVLFHLHNREAPKFVQQCAHCARDILSGYRYHCPTCVDFDLCPECFQKQAQAANRHPHPLKPIAISTAQQSEMTPEQRRERKRSIQLHMNLLLHAATCSNPKCHSQNCAKMKGLLKHGESCTTKAQGGCNICKRIWTLFQLHARQCKEKNCPVPRCLAIRERLRLLSKQQQAMDDRRRQQMNQHYNRSVR